MPKNRVPFGRRAFLLGLGVLAGAGALAVADRSEDGTSRTTLTMSGEGSLRERATRKSLIYGAAARYKTLSTDSDLAASFVKECAMLVPENELKWNVIRAQPNSFNFAPGDWMANFAKKHDLLFRGTPLVWYKSFPKWFESKVTSQNAEKMLVEHIEKVAGHYAGKIHSWDVVNEAINIEDKNPDGLRNSPWLKFLGPDYIEIAFRAAAQADPQALLVYNDYGLEYDTPAETARRNAVLKLLERLKSKGTPVHILGVQAHLLRRGNEMSDFNPATVKAFLDDVASMGLKIMITEIDVTDEKLPKDVAARDRIVASAYEDYLSVALENPATIGVLTWGLSDRSTWLTKNKPRADGAPVRPLPLDAQLNRKLAWQAIARTLDKAPERPSQHQTRT